MAAAPASAAQVEFDAASYRRTLAACAQTELPGVRSRAGTSHPARRRRYAPADLSGVTPAAVASLGPVRVGGAVAWVLWLVVGLALLTGFKIRVATRVQDDFVLAA